VQLRDLIPWRTFTIGTSWPPDVAVIELKKRVDQSRFLSSGRRDAPFVGDIRGASDFKLRLRMAYVRAQTITRVVAEPSHHGGTLFRVTVRLPVAALAFMGMWMTAATLVGLEGVVAAIMGRPAALLVLGFPLVGTAFMGIPFALEARKAESLLRTIFVSAPALPDPVETGEAYR
jgi:hypothetical protein